MSVVVTGTSGRFKIFKVLQPLLTSGLTPEKLSFTVCLGSATGVMPLLWGTTILCAGLAAKFRLNQAAIQAVNYCCYPVQLALFIPFCRLGEFLFPWGPRVTVSVLKAALHGNVGASLSLLGWATVRGLGAWTFTALPLFLLMHPLLKQILASRHRKQTRQ